MRDIVARNFQTLIENGIESVQTIAIVGGSLDEPELQALDLRDKKIDVLGVENSDYLLDLNERNWIPNRQFDLVLCSQVLEHVWRPETALRNLAALVNPGGLLWIACPASNFRHGSPEFFSAGYAPELITRNLESLGLETIASSQVASRRNYIARHRFLLWLSESETRKPLLYMHSTSISESVSRFKRYALSLLLLSFLRDSDLPIWAVETFVLSRKSLV